MIGRTVQLIYERQKLKDFNSKIIITIVADVSHFNGAAPELFLTYENDTSISNISSPRRLSVCCGERKPADGSENEVVNSRFQ